ncbi:MULTISPECIES: HD-GYP domain-containing protein [unclassified Oceanispirochaeta]|nr:MULTISPECIES: HD domain-containing phosphohydrolase [unclassified Oceanispirochaeta]MBF9018804.1 HD domain-containing protein [Oceanispirochaeta sp. M2]NPD75273.1 HD domain-containing protein [Oceanispirochaeta sp. M1]
MTIIIAFLMSWVLVNQIKHQMIIGHSDFYQSYVRAIPENYSEIIPLLDNHTLLNKTPDSSEKDEHHDSFNVETPDIRWLHFKTDLLQYPTVKQFRIINRENEVIWQFKDQNIPENSSPFNTMIKNLEHKDISYHIQSENPYFLVYYYIPIIVEEENIGTVEILDLDPNLRKSIIKNRKLVILMIFIGGFLFYSSLFFLFSRVYYNQSKALDKLDKSQSLTIYTMSQLAELRDDNTGAHINRTSLYCKILGSELSKVDKYKNYLTKAYLDDLERSAPLHDIGKVGIPDSILQKPGKLSAEEFEIIKTHPQLGAKVLKNASESLDFQSFFEIGYQIVLYHHENWDGSGYPFGTIAEEIPLSARIMSISDVYDALTTSRPYKSAFSHEKAMKIIVDDSGKKFDPDLIDALLNISDQFREISKQ